MTGDVGEKRKCPVEKKVLMLINSEESEKIAALFQFNIQITKTVSGVVSEILLTDYDTTAVLRPLACFYDITAIFQIRSVSACVLNDSKVYIMADDLETGMYYDPDSVWKPGSDVHKLICQPRDRLPVFIFDLKTYETQQLPPDLLPQTRKGGPILVPFNNDTSLFAFSAYTFPFFKVLDPCLESLDLSNNKWSPLPCPPFHIPFDLDDEEPFCVFGHAVLLDDNNSNEDGYLLFSLSQHGSRHNPVRFYTYNIRSNIWKPALLPHPDGVDTPRLIGEAVAIGNDIYAYHNDKKLYVFSYYNIPGGDGTHDLALSPASLVQGLKCQEKQIRSRYWVPDFSYSSTITKVDDDTLCLLHTIYPECFQLHCVCVTFIQIKERELCTTLKSFICNLLPGYSLSSLTIKSCFILNNLEEERDHHSGKRPVMPSDADDSLNGDEPMCDKGGECT